MVNSSTTHHSLLLPEVTIPERRAAFMQPELDELDQWIDARGGDIGVVRGIVSRVEADRQVAPSRRLD